MKDNPRPFSHRRRLVEYYWPDMVEWVRCCNALCMYHTKGRALRYLYVKLPLVKWYKEKRTVPWVVHTALQMAGLEGFNDDCTQFDFELAEEERAHDRLSRGAAAGPEITDAFATRRRTLEDGDRES